MAKYKYKKGEFYIDISRNLEILDANNLNYDFKWILHLDIGNYSLEDDSNMVKGRQYLAFIHELIHYYQDLSLPSCICEHLYKTKYIRAQYAKNKYGGTEDFKFTSNNNEALYDYIYKTKIALDIDSLSNFLNNYQPLKFSTNGSHFFPEFDYNDMLEGYAELKSWQTIICETKDSTENHRYIKNLLQQRNKTFAKDINGEDAISCKFNDKERRYVLMRFLFLSFFHHIKRSNFCLCTTITKYSELSVIDYLLFMDNIDVIEKTSYPGGYTYRKEVQISDKQYLLQCERGLLKWVLLVLEMAFCIPTIEYISTLIHEKKNTKEDFHPGCRFFKILSVIYKFPDFFNQIDENDRWVYVFDNVSRCLGWPLYMDTVNSVLLDNNEVKSNIYSYQKEFIKTRFTSTMETYNGAIFRQIRKLRIPIPFHFLDKFLFVTYTDKDVQECVISDFHIDALNYYKKNADNRMPTIAEITANSLNIYMYKTVKENRSFKCPCKWCIKYDICDAHNLSEILTFNRIHCYLRYHIEYEIENITNNQYPNL